MKIGPLVSELRGRKSLSRIDLAHGFYNNLYTTVQAVILLPCSRALGAISTVMCEIVSCMFFLSYKQ